MEAAINGSITETSGRIQPNVANPNDKLCAKVKTEH
jgi:hypothetical protein